MIDWWNVAGHAVWIFGAAMLLARFSYRRYEKAEAKQLGSEQKPLTPDRIYRLGLLLVSVGLGATSTSWMQRGIWALLAIISMVELVMLRPRRTLRLPESDEQV